MRQAEATLHRGARASHYRGLSCCGAQAPDAQAQQLWFTGLVAPRHVGSPQTRARTRVPCIGRQILNHCATREAQPLNIFKFQNIVCRAWCTELMKCHSHDHGSIHDPLYSLIFKNSLRYTHKPSTRSGRWPCPVPPPP